LAGDEKVVRTDGFTEPFKGCANPARMLCVFCGEVHNLQRTLQEGGDAFSVRLEALALSDSIPELEEHHRGGGDYVVTRTDARKASPHRLGPTINQRDTCVGIE
jgi:hypothetical protein